LEPIKIRKQRVFLKWTLFKMPPEGMCSNMFFYCLDFFFVGFMLHILYSVIYIVYYFFIINNGLLDIIYLLLKFTVLFTVSLPQPTFRHFGFISPKTLNYMAFQSFDFEWTRQR
jgi:hypothetical protein